MAKDKTEERAYVDVLGKPAENDTPAGKVKMVSNGIIRFIPKNRVDEYKKLGYSVM